MSGTSGTYGSFNPALSDIMLDAYERCGKLGVELTQQSQMLSSARRSMNFVLTSWANRGVNLWTVQEVVQPMAAEQTQFFDDASCVDILADSVLVRQTYNGVNTDIRMYPLSRTDWVSQPQKIVPGRPTSYWVDRQIIPVISVWPQAPVSGVYFLVYRRSRFIQDADFVGGEQLAVPQRFFEAFTAALATHLSIKWAPERTKILADYAMTEWQLAASEDEERVSLFIAPDMSGYWSV